jgi:TorA maturation chaperone TorD/Pyruvate/2-oxoacid:ferredoxin oxidoreductase delta subunit
MTAELLSALYTGLASALAVETAWPDWLTTAGREWPLWLPATRLAADHHWPILSQAITALAEVPTASRKKRQAAYEALVACNGRPPLSLYESQHLNGRLLGPETMAVGDLYRQVGLEIEGAELPDHAAIELEFLSFLTEQEMADPAHNRDWRTARRMFLKQHAGRWLPDVGRRLATASDPAWGAIGQLLTAVLSPPKNGRVLPTTGLNLPQIAQADACNLCGFCVQVCPTRALWIDEDTQMTRLRLMTDLCVRCRKCERVCDEQALKMMGASLPQTAIVLRQSPRAICPGCGVPTVSQAELTAVAARLGHHPAWLDHCLDCRGRMV